MGSGRIVILGGGFGGVKCARALRKKLPHDYEIVVFNSENHMVFHPLLAEVAGGAIQPKDVAAPLRQMLNGVHCRTENVQALDLKNNAIEYEAHDGRRKQLSYDHLVIACGSEVNLGMVPGMAETAFALKTVGDALALQAHIMEQLEKAEVCDDPAMRKWYMRFIIVGAGFSGVELAGEVNDLLKRSLRFFLNVKQSDIDVVLVHAGDEILPQISPSLRVFARTRLEKHGVRVLLDAKASAATPQGIVLTDGKLISGATVVCTVGNTIAPVLAKLDVPKTQGRLVTEADMKLPGYSNVWAIGDCAAIHNMADGKLSPPMAQFAERQGKQCANNIIATMNGAATKPFSFKMLGQLCAIGGHSAVAEIMGFRLSGFIAWFLWRGIYLSKLPSFALQARVGMEWALDLVFPRTLAHLKADRTHSVGRAFYPAGDYVFREGDPASEFYVIESGEVDILNGKDESAEIIAVLGPGDFFGEAALLAGRPRSATVRARTDIELTVLGASVFSQISACLDPLRDAMASAMKRRTNIWKSLHKMRDVLDNVPLKEMLEPLPDDPIKPDCRIEQLVERLNNEHLDFVIVVDEGKKLIGIVTRSDLFRAIEVAASLPEGTHWQLTVKDIMAQEPICVSLDEGTSAVVMTMREHGLKFIPVLESCESRIVKGYVRIENIMHRVVQHVLHETSITPQRNMKTTTIMTKVKTT